MEVGKSVEQTWLLEDGVVALHEHVLNIVPIERKSRAVIHRLALHVAVASALQRRRRIDGKGKIGMPALKLLQRAGYVRLEARPVMVRKDEHRVLWY